MNCKFDVAWRGQCKELSLPGSDYCEEHSKEKCCVCGKQATHDCDRTLGGLVCGHPLCDEHSCPKH